MRARRHQRTAELAEHNFHRLPTLVFQNRSDPVFLGLHSVFDPNADVVGRYEAILEEETASVSWLFSPKDRRMIGYPLPWQILSPFHVITSQRYLYDYLTPVWRAGNGSQNFRATLIDFWNAKPSSSERVTFDEFDNVPAQAFQLPWYSSNLKCEGLGPPFRRSTDRMLGGSA